MGELDEAVGQVSCLKPCFIHSTRQVVLWLEAVVPLPLFKRFPVLKSVWPQLFLRVILLTNEHIPKRSKGLQKDRIGYDSLGLGVNRIESPVVVLAKLVLDLFVRVRHKPFALHLPQVSLALVPFDGGVTSAEEVPELLVLYDAVSVSIKPSHDGIELFIGHLFLIATCLEKALDLVFSDLFTSSNCLIDFPQVELPSLSEFLLKVLLLLLIHDLLIEQFGQSPLNLWSQGMLKAE